LSGTEVTAGSFSPGAFFPFFRCAQAETFTAQLKEQATQIQKVSAQLEASKPAPQVVNNP
jgi:hypothetical protein